MWPFLSTRISHFHYNSTVLLSCPAIALLGISKYEVDRWCASAVAKVSLFSMADKVKLTVAPGMHLTEAGE